MTPLPPLPTDNLYKFCALTGLAMILVSSYASWSITNQLFNLERQQELAVEKAIIEADFFKSESAVNDRDYKDLLWNQNKSEKDRPPDDVLRVPLSPEEFQRRLEKRLGLAKQVLLSDKEVQSREKEIGWLANQRMLVRWIAAAGIVNGLILSIYGFRNWRALQLHQDKLFFAQNRLAG